MLLQEKAFDDMDEWHLLADELSLLPGMTDTGRLGFALQLKFRQVQGHYPDSVHDFPSGIVHTIAEQVGCASVSPENYSLFWTTASPYKSGRSDTKIQEGSIGTSCRHLLPGFNS
ncbi:transposase Tn3 family protein [Klebsiella pneumoniae]|uniref:Transposase Tn3 family protein n=2 Tax=Klebsiella pneumoniae TaxID=573 RepID=A0A378UDL7_KLEPO|nr:transposase Tn3 family protein [Klebsiella pneumoniae]STZ75270.1 transposase Tn3 family protein [Klebsiella pneumoniae subsp. ozaenae]SPX51708.1 transposase Tn3 family protein [Klebsiella pneumoniae]STR95136.1 transposase Tn3 family protein [Klebsiella pneumoniae]STS59947.1 transposase Tn3 family protein [Klebsiella pneumoniae]